MQQITQTRQDLQLARRLFHLLAGSISAFFYYHFLDHQQAVYMLGSILCILYIFEQIRINYPEYSKFFSKVSVYFLRAEEQLKESAQIPYAMGMLLTILTFPKPIAMTAILTLAISDPASAIIGIKFGKRHIVEHKSLEGSLAFFITCFLSIFFVYYYLYSVKISTTIIIGIIVSLIVTTFEMLPIRLDDNLTIPLFTSFALWPFVTLLGI